MNLLLNFLSLFLLSRFLLLRLFMHLFGRLLLLFNYLLNLWSFFLSRCFRLLFSFNLHLFTFCLVLDNFLSYLSLLHNSLLTLSIFNSRLSYCFNSIFE
jgi:hypothetical protein